MRLEIGLSNGTFYSVRADGFVSFNDYENPASGDNIVHSLDEDGDIGLRTPIGKLNGVTGEPITEETYLGTIDGSGNRVNGVLATGTFRINVSYENGTVTVVYRLYQDGHDDFRTDAPYFEFTVAISGLTDAELDIEFFADNVNIGNSSNVWMTTGDINNTMISSFSGDSDTITAGGEAFTAAGSYSSLGVEGGYALVAGEGNARDLTDEQKKALGIPDGDTTYEKYVAFTVNFEKAYAGEDSIVSAKVVGEPYAFAAFSDDKTALNVVIPFAGEKTEYVIDLSNSGGYTLQADISLDLSAVSTYSVSTQVSGEPTLGGGGQMTITYSGPDLPANVSFRVNGADVAVGSSSADGVMLVSYKDNTLTLTLPSFVSAPKAFTIDMINADNGLLVASRTVSATTVGSDSNTATVETDDGTAYAVVNGNNLAVVFAGVAPGSTQDLWINANMGTANDVSLIGWKNYQFTTYASGAIEFTNAANNAATDSIGYYFVEGRWYAVVNIGLAPMGVTANADYGFELSFAESAVAASEGYVTYYFVSAGSVEEKQVSADTAATEIVPNSCTTVGYNGIRVEGGKFYANISVEPAHDWRESDVDGQYICSVCGAILHSGSATNASIDALGTTEAGSLVDTGLTVSFWMSGATSDWGAIGLSVGSGSVKITMPNLDSWAPNLGSGATEREQELAELVKETNAYPNASNLQSGFDYATFLNKSVYATIVISMTEGIKYYANGELAVEYQINVDLSTDNGKHPLQSQYFAELFLLLAQRQGFVISQSGMQAENAIIERDTLTADEVAARYTAYLAEHSYYPAGAETPTHPEWDEDGAFVIGAADNSTAYTIDLKTYGVERGETLTLEGTLTSKGNDPKEGETTFGAWNAPVITLYNGISVSPVTIRADNWVLGADSGQSGEKAACSSLGWTIQKTAPALENTIEENTDVWAEIRPIMNGSTLRIAFSYSADGKSFTVAYTFISDGHSWTETYVLTSSDGAELGDDAFSFGIGVDRCSYNVTSFVRS